MITTNTGAKKLESSDNWREIFPDNQGAQGAHNASVGAHDAAISQMGQTINGTTNNSGHTINSGEFFIANGGKYKATASIPNGEPWASSAESVTDNDLISALNNSLTQKQNVLVRTSLSTNYLDISGYTSVFDSLPTYYYGGIFIQFSGNTNGFGFVVKTGANWGNMIISIDYDEEPIQFLVSSTTKKLRRIQTHSIT